MKRIIQKSGAFVIMAFVLCGVLAPFSLARTFAQGNGLFDTLDVIKGKTQGYGGVIQFSDQKPWGDLSDSIVKKIEAKGFTGLKDVFAAAQYSDSQKNYQALADFLKANFGLSDDEVNSIVLSINMIDFSQGRMWGNLPQETIKLLASPPYGSGIYPSLDTIINDANDAIAKKTYATFDAFVKDIPGMADKPGGDLNKNGFLLLGEIIYQGESQLHSVVISVVQVLRNLMGSVAVVFIVVSGILMVFAQGDETKITEQKRSITYAIIGLVAILLIERMVSAIYGVPGEQRALTPNTAAQVSVEIYGLVSYIKAILGSVAIFMIVISGVRTLTATEEDQLISQRRAIRWTLVGLALILINQVVVENIFVKPAQSASGTITKTNVQNILDLFGKVAEFLMGFVGLIAFAALIYGAASMVINFGNDELVGKAKKIITNSLIGIVIILSTYAIVATMIRSAS
jgi:hypothetical protein